MSVARKQRLPRAAIGALNGAHHRATLGLYLVIVLAHWAEHLVQAYQIWVLGWSRPEARGVLGVPFPWLVSSEWMHYGYAIVMLIGLFALRPGFVGRARTWWTIALVIQFWHHVEHLFLLLQVQVGFLLPGTTVPTSVLQLVVPRVELHLFYNSVVFLPMLIAMYLHLRPNATEQRQMSCSCTHAGQDRMALAPSAR
ncbi:hypothetical protein [Micromonospora deserti]|uniref:Uncharacterized protein n=1 Tax=Micromonospora deserti TaxID=2070366 RepID=A0A2W2DTH6_9ACTN|nr:hypothetical protein [Micromonospora deserti]PZF96063.1 hypothetical protein C1I99_17465 [Micromonospora deserti]